MTQRTARVGVLLVGMAGFAGAQPPAEVAAPTLLSIDAAPAGASHVEAASSAYPDGSFGEQLSAAQSGGGGPVGSSKYRPGPGRRDDWKVGPHWRVTVDGLVLFRDDADLDAILGEVDPIAPQSTLPPLAFRDNFDHAAGVRVMLTSDFPQCEGYELQVGYLGAEKWLANATYALETIPEAALPVSDVDVFQQRQVTYDSGLHSVEVNFQRETAGYLKPFAGLRYFGFDESIVDDNRQFTTAVLGDPAAVGDSISSAVTQTRTTVEAENNLIGFQGGLRLDMWRPTRRLHLNGFASAGVYCDLIDRSRVFQESTTVVTRQRVSVPGAGGAPATEQVTTSTATGGGTSVVSADGAKIAFASEAALAATWRLNDALAIRGGYQVLFLQEVQLAEDLWTAPPPITSVEDDLFLHGWFAGLEYRR